MFCGGGDVCFVMWGRGCMFCSVGEGMYVLFCGGRGCMFCSVGEGMFVLWGEGRERKICFVLWGREVCFVLCAGFPQSWKVMETEENK